ncbi:arabinose operon transcriptional regulator AraC [Necropsobacter massiliensis]|uniref:arabinose operon transcriptional regulator AraC n=1 Tax=Necropsobacter massiliensis TaxID=1400001 RepID=UPI0005962E5B|nr:arabinose operon transcriptional regulator AraC [Necropsobacter massiliensis]
MRSKINPLLVNYHFNLELAAGITQIERGNYMDFTIDRPNGMNGYILQLTTFGKGDVFDGENIYSVERGQLLLFAPYAVHHYGRNLQNEFWHYKWIYFYPNSQWVKWLNWTDTQNTIGKIQITDNQYFHEISQLFTKIAQELQSNNIFKQEIALSLLKYLLMKCFSAEQPQMQSGLDNRIVVVCNLIAENLMQNLTIQELADKVFLSPSRLSHLFSESIGSSIIQWRETLRITEAKKHLYFSDISINLLAKNLGYEDPLYFSKIFKKHTALSPTEFRQLYKTRKA